MESMETSMSERLKIVFSHYDNLESAEERERMIDLLEGIITDLNEAAQKGEELVSDGVYDTVCDYLAQLKPNSRVLHTLWSADDPTNKVDVVLDKFLKQYPMKSIRTVKHITDLPVKEFQNMLPINEVEIIAPIKLNGHGIRFVVQYGKIVSASSRGRSTIGKDYLMQVTRILGNEIPTLANVPLVEIRAEAMLPFYRLQKAREFNPTIKSAFTAVASMIRASASEEETKLLDIVCYDILSDDLAFNTLEEKYLFLQNCGLKIPVYTKLTVNRRTLQNGIEKALSVMEELTEDYEYYTDGVVFSINDLDLFASFGEGDKFRYGNMALKIGKWAQDGYTGIISHIDWKQGKSKLTPVAVLKEGVVTMTGNTVVNVPLYSPLYILLLEAYPDNPIHFKYGGEAGVVPITHDGRLVTDLTLESWGELVIE